MFQLPVIEKFKEFVFGSLLDGDEGFVPKSNQGALDVTFQFDIKKCVQADNFALNVLLNK